MTPPRHGRRLSAEERELWRGVARSVKPLRVPKSAAAVDVAEEVRDQLAMAEALAPGGTKPVQRSLAKPAAARPSPPPLAPLGRRERQRVARGREAIDARLDLHGMTQAQAHAALIRFLLRAQADGARLALVVTGKGGRGSGEGGVLRRQVPHWLALPELRRLIVGFEPAHIRHGGEGALYVRLRRA